MRLRVVLAVVVPSLFASLPALGTSGPLGLASALTAGLAVVAVAAVFLVHLAPPPAPASVRTIRMREFAWQAAFLRLRDPDAKGRTRPRAPTPRSTAA